ncbi:MAG: fibronectin type III domain-containing protein [Deltaproteobacteria bacterium]|nr:fibronectin type III domain-containing protein [Deltaproteobacteria bacterium]
MRAVISILAGIFSLLLASEVSAARRLPSLLGPVSDRLNIVEADLDDSGVLRLVLTGAEELRGEDLQREDLLKRLLWQARADLGEGMVTGVDAWLRLPEGKLQKLSDFLADPAEAELLARIQAEGPRSPRTLPPADLPYGGSLSGRRIAISPGHGWTYYDSLSDWSYQRSLINIPGCESCRGIIEDLSNGEIAYRYLIPTLLRAGADVFSVRERDPQIFETLVDDGDEAYAEEGPWFEGSNTGGYEGDYRVLSSNDPGRAVYTLRPEQDGWYWVGLRYVAHENRVTDVLVRIRHAGGEAKHHVDQTGHGRRWLHLGRYYFTAEHGGQLSLEAGSEAEADRFLVADAVRLGGGLDQTLVGGKAANHARWQMNARRNCAYFGLPDEFYPGSDVTVRPVAAEWQGADAYVSLHSNATGTEVNYASGTSSYRYNCGTYPDHSAAPDPADCDDPPGSDALQQAVHGAIIEFLRNDWDPNWRDRGRLVANFGEMRALDGIPGVLVESAFHDGTEPASEDMRMADNLALQDPRFREALAYAIYAGLVRFFDPEAVLLPADRPLGLSLTHAAASGMLLSWQPVASADGYRVRWWLDGLELVGDGRLVEDSYTLIEDLPPGATVQVQVSALNAGGEGPPSPADLLIVSGFDRQDPYVGDTHNERDQVLAHASAIMQLERNIYFDAVSNEAVLSGVVDLPKYQAVLWILGEESTLDETFSDAEQALVTDYLDGGGAIMASGAEIGWDMVELGSASDQAFIADCFGAGYVSDDSDSHTAWGTGILGGVEGLVFDDGSHGIYPVEWPDVWEAAGGEVVLWYDEGGGAAVAHAREPGLSLILGFPFETIISTTARERLMDGALAFLLSGHVPDDFDADGLPDAWESEHDTRPTEASADEDPDNDGLNNLEEYEGGTDPQHPEGQEEADAGEPDAGEPDAGEPDASDADGGISDEDDPQKGCGCAQHSGQAWSAWTLLAGLAFLSRRRKPC